MIWGHHKILQHLDELFPKEKPYKIGAASVDVRVGDTMMTEHGGKIDLTAFAEDNPYVMCGGEFMLVAMQEYTVVPKGVSCLFLLKSTIARMGFSHSFAGWIDPGWIGILTMELKNYNQVKELPLYPGMPIGQLIYMDTDDSGLYGGRYLGDTVVQGPKKEIDYNAGE
jgi:dCTP deaminase